MNPIRPLRLLRSSLPRAAAPAAPRAVSLRRGLTTPTTPNQASVSSVNVEHVREDPGENEDGDVIAGQTEGGKGE